jgi:transglutaminase-like putative cysteine protease
VRFDIRYRCAFTYRNLVRESQNELRACPASGDGQQLVSYRVATSPPCRVLSFSDYWGTRVDVFGVREPHVHLEVVAEASVETRGRPLATNVSRSAELRELSFVDDHIEYLSPSAHVQWGARVADAAARAVEVAGDDVINQALAIHRSVGARLDYVPGSTYVGVDVEEVLARGQGVCQDYAHLAVALCRSRGIPARYVSGYLFAVDPSGRTEAAHDQTVTVQTHAWFEAAIPGFGWLALDPTNQQEVGVRHVKIGHGRDYDDVQPLRGVFAGTSGSEVEVSVEIRRFEAGVAPAGDPFTIRRTSGATVGLTGPPGDTGMQQQQQ